MLLSCRATQVVHESDLVPNAAKLPYKSLQQSAGVIEEVECESEQVANVPKLQRKNQHHIACMGEGIVHDSQLLPNIEEGKPSTQCCRAAMR